MVVRAKHLVEERQSSATDAAHSRGRGVSRGATPASDAEVEKASEAREAQRRSGAAAQRRSGAAAQRRSGAQALTTPPPNRSSRSKLTFALIRVSCDIQKASARVSWWLLTKHDSRCLLCCLPCCLFEHNGRRDGRPSTGLAPCARKCPIWGVLPCRVSCCCVFFFVHWWERRGKPPCGLLDPQLISG